MSDEDARYGYCGDCRSYIRVEFPDRSSRDWRDGNLVGPNGYIIGPFEKSFEKYERMKGAGEAACPHGVRPCKGVDAALRKLVQARSTLSFGDPLYEEWQIALDERLPSISDERLADLHERISPVYLRKEDLWFMKKPEPRTIAFTWTPKPSHPALGLRELATIHTLHTWAYYGFFKPTCAEVLAQIQNRFDLDDILAYRTTMFLDGSTEAIDGPHHVGMTTLYGQTSG